MFFVNYDFLKDLSVDNLMQFDQKIASFTRHSGTDEEYQAFLYMKENMKVLGTARNLFFMTRISAFRCPQSLR